MSENPIERTFVAWVRTIAEISPSGVRSAILVGAWLALTGLFLFGGVVLVGTVVTALGQSLRVVSTLVTLVGVLAACGVAPILARVTVGAADQRLDAVFERDADAERGGRLFSLCEMKGQANCRSSCSCCC